jgi:quercetin dioxygenase-like cupin family protein
MGIAQAIAACETYRKAAGESGHAPAFFVTHISGILDEQLKAEAEALGVALSPEAIRIAGCAVAKKEYALLQERGLPGIMLGGGARGLHHFTEMVGGKAHVTLNWPGSIQVLEENPPAIESRLDQPVSETIVRELCAKLPTFARAYAEDGLKPGEFADFGPVVRFRTQFLKGWNELLDAVRQRRAATRTTAHRGFCRVGEHPVVEMRPGVFRSTLVHNADQMLCHFRETAGARVDLHTHLAVQSGYVLRGSVRFFDAAGKERVMGPGDAYLFNSNEPHGSVALEETELVECFTPARPEYLD